MARPRKEQPPVEQPKTFTIRQVEIDALALYDRDGHEIARKFYYRANPEARALTIKILAGMVPAGMEIIDEGVVEDVSDWRSDPSLL